MFELVGTIVTSRSAPFKMGWLVHLRSHDRHKLLFGDNCPMIALHIALDGLAELALAEATRALSREHCAPHVRIQAWRSWAPGASPDAR